MKQYLVEVPDEAKVVESTNTLIFDAAPATGRTCRRVKGTELYTETSVKIVADENLKRGHEEAWELAQKIVTDVDNGGYSCNDLRAIFEKSTMGYAMCAQVITENTYDEATKKIQAWEEKEKAIHVGDIVLDTDDDKCVVLRASSTYCTLMYADGSMGTYKNTDLKKTGKTVDILAMLEQIKEA